jgi:CRISPR-associated protein Cas6/Cse3/CasE subtype I-E
MTTHLVRLELDRDNTERFRQVHPGIKALGYRVHAAVDALFPKRKLRPFHIAKIGEDYIVILAYSHQSAEELGQNLDLADPEIHSLLLEGTLKSKPMPRLKEGQVIRFFVQAQPTGRSNGSGRRDVDVFIRALNQQKGGSVCREEVYVDWLRGKLERSGAVEVVEARVSNWAIVCRDRQTSDNRVVRHRAPEAEMSGILRIKEPENLLQFLTQGVGRSKGFGCGMLRLAPL